MEYRKVEGFITGRSGKLVSLSGYIIAERNRLVNSFFDDFGKKISILTIFSCRRTQYDSFLYIAVIYGILMQKETVFYG